MSEFTEKEIVAVKEFRKRVADVLQNDSYSQRDDSLIRWVRARELDLDKAEDMYRKSLLWRANNKIDRLLDSGPDAEMLKRYPFYLDGVDKQGRPVLTIPYGTWDVRSLIEAEGPDRMVLHLNLLLESVMAQVREKTIANKDEPGRNNGLQFVVVSNMDGYSYRQLANMSAVQTLLQLVSVFEAHYPETLFKAIVINAPSIFSILFGMMKAFMSGHTASKFEVFSAKKHQWQPAILELVDPSQIREQFGGTMKI